MSDEPQAVVVAASTKSARTTVDGGLTITFEIAPADVAKAFAAFGLAGSTVAITPITKDAARAKTQADYAGGDQPPSVTKPERFTQLKPSNQAALRCQEPEFWKFLSKRLPGNIVSEKAAAAVLRELCQIASRSELDRDPEKAAIWMRLEADYWAEQHGRR